MILTKYIQDAWRIQQIIMNKKREKNSNIWLARKETVKKRDFCAFDQTLTEGKMRLPACRAIVL